MQIGSQWKHYSGRVYTILNFALNHQLERMVIYKGLPIKENPNGVWVRPVKEFIAKLRLDDGREIFRFTRLR